MSIPKFPDVIRIEPSGVCNLRCIHCPTGRGMTNGGIMSEETFGVVMQQIEKRVPRVVVMYHGGEPLLCKNIWDWITMLKRLGVKHIRTITNGMMLDDGEIENMIVSGLDEVIISIDGTSYEENDFIRQGSDCSQIIGDVKRLFEIKRKMCSVTPSIGISNVQLSNHHYDDKRPEIPMFLLDAFEKCDVVFESYYALKWAGWDKMDGCVAHPPQVHDGYCPYLYETMTIRWNGDVVPCCYDIAGKCILGNIYKEGLDDIWGGLLYEVVREGLRDGNVVKVCEGCCGY